MILCNTCFMVNSLFHISLLDFKMMSTSSNKSKKKYNGMNLLEVAQSFNNFYFDGIKNTSYKPLLCQGNQIGIVSPKAERELKLYEDVFVIQSRKVEICPDLEKKDEITEKIKAVMVQLRDKNCFAVLEKWTDEVMEIRASSSKPSLFAIERAAARY